MKKIKLSRSKCVLIGKDIKHLENRTGLRKEGVELLVSLMEQLEEIAKKVNESEAMPFNEGVDKLLKDEEREKGTFRAKHLKVFTAFRKAGGKENEMPKSLEPEWKLILEPFEKRHAKAIKFINDHRTKSNNFKNEEVEIKLLHDPEKIDLILSCTPFEWRAIKQLFI